MLILPDRSVLRPKLNAGCEAPAPRSFVPALGVWSPPGRPFCLVGKLRGKIIWRAHFRSQDELDVFCWSLFRGELERDEFARGLVLPAWNPELAEWPVVYEMAVSVTNIGVATGQTSFSLTVGGSGTPAGALLFVATYEESSIGEFLGSLSDGTNTYVNNAIGRPNGSGSGGVGATWYVANAAALSSAATITFTCYTSGDYAAISACYATGIATVSPLDTATEASAQGSSSTPSVTSGAPSTSGELFFGVLFFTKNETFSQASGWAAPPNTESMTGGLSIFGGNQIGASSALTYNPTTGGNSALWLVLIAAFKAAATLTGGFSFFNSSELGSLTPIMVDY